jgi:DnaJ-class molecular chaperone
MDYEQAKKILNIENDNHKEIRDKYRKQALLHHPDKKGNKD